MSFAAYKMMQCPTGIDNCAAGFLTHSRSDFVPLQPDDLDAEWPSRPRQLALLPNLVVTAANVLEVYAVRIQEDQPPKPADSRRGALLDGIAGASLELVCHYRFHLSPLVLESELCLVQCGLGYGNLVSDDYMGFLDDNGNVEHVLDYGLL
ncbi:Cleavage and polyadenylation specificity factor subunit 1, partial [Mucuna pruriens]